MTTTAVTTPWVSVSKPGQNYFYSNGYDLPNEMLANGSILSEIMFFAQ
jgi:hypothetical protein